MEPADRIIALLEEIRDIQRTWMERATRVQDESLRRQLAISALYKRALIAGTVMLAFLVGYLFYLGSRG